MREDQAQENRRGGRAVAERIHGGGAQGHTVDPRSEIPVVKEHIELDGDRSGKNSDGHTRKDDVLRMQDP